MRNFLSMSIILLLLGSFSVFAAGSEEEIVIGVAGPFTGDFANYGIPTQRAVNDYVETVNAAGGVKGRTIRVVAEDEQCAAEQAVNVSQKLVDEGAVAVIGHICSSATIAALSTYTDVGIPVVSPSSTNTSITFSGDFPTFARTISYDAKQAEVQLEYLNEIGVETIAVLHDKGDYGKGLADNAIEEAEKYGIEVLLFEGITPGALDYSAIVLKVAGVNPDAVIFGGYHPEASKLVSQMVSQNFTVPFIGGDGIKTDTFIGLAKEEAEGVYATSPEDTSRLPMTTAVRAAHIEKYGEEPGVFFDNGYAAIQVVVEALNNAESLDAESVLAAIKGGTFDTTVGTISFDEKGDVIGVGFAVYQVVDGSYVQVD